MEKPENGPAQAGAPSPSTGKRTSVKGLALERLDIPPLDPNQHNPPIVRKESKGVATLSPKIEREESDPKEKKKEKDPLKLAEGEKEVNIKGILLVTFLCWDQLTINYRTWFNSYRGQRGI